MAFSGQSEDGTYKSSLPGWAHLVAYLGFPIVVASFLLAQGAGFIASPQDRAEAELRSQHMRIEKFMTDQDTALREHRIRQEDLIRLLATGLKVICENGAHSVPERNNCATIQSSARYLSP